MRLNSVPRVRVVLALLVIPLFTMGCLAWPAILAISPSTMGRTPVLLAATRTSTGVEPTTTAGETSITVEGTYFHTSGVLSLPQIKGWGSSEEKVDPYGPNKLSRAGVTFISRAELSVVHAFVEHDPDTTPKTVDGFNAFFDKSGLDAAWANYTGGWKELNRHKEKDVFVINLELRLENYVYLARMLARIDQGWLAELRLVVPENNPNLLENLNTAIWLNFNFWIQGTTTPMAWSSVIDQTAGYVIKFPPDWHVLSGEPGEPFNVRGTADGNSVDLTTNGVAGQSVTSKDQAALWVKSSHPYATKITAKAGGKTNRYEFLVTYAVVNPNNASSGLVGFVNGKNKTLYTVDILYSAAGLNLTNELATNIPFVLSQVRASFFLVVPGADPKVRATTTPTPAPTAVKR